MPIPRVVCGLCSTITYRFLKVCSVWTHLVMPTMRFYGCQYRSDGQLIVHIGPDFGWTGTKFCTDIHGFHIVIYSNDFSSSATIDICGFECLESSRQPVEELLWNLVQTFFVPHKMNCDSFHLVPSSDQNFNLVYDHLPAKLMTFSSALMLISKC